MFRKRTEAIKAQIEAQRRAQHAPEETLPTKRVTDRELFAMPGANYRVVTVPKVN